ncbi:MAG: hypothetical protein LBD91_03815 [Prevotellaceae bacterium]|nr:hypothetical protein [Prevotellaceae bacterium]
MNYSTFRLWPLPAAADILKGTPPFIINGNIIEPSHTFGAWTCITSITDSTGCPGFVVNTSIVTGTIPSSGETVCVGGAPNAITSIAAFSGGDGQLSYSWYKDGVLISSATAEDYIPPMEDAAVACTYTYTRRVNDQTCNTNPQASEGNYVLTVIKDPSVTVVDEQSICYNAVPTAMTATQSSGAGDVSYQWYSGAAATSMTNIGDATAPTYAPGALTTTTTTGTNTIRCPSGYPCYNNPFEVQAVSSHGCYLSNMASFSVIFCSE